MVTHANIIQVDYSKGPEKVPMGRLAIKSRRIFFEYAPEFLKMNFELSPFKLPLKTGVISCEDHIFGGLFGVFNDSLPDGWGRLLLDRKLMRLGINPGEITPLDRLRYVGGRGMGALSYKPEMEDSLQSYHEDLDEISDECLKFQEHDSDQFVDALLTMTGSSAGARPKILVSFENGFFQATNNAAATKLNDWIIKFRSSSDPKDIGPIEYAYHLMAIAAGIDVPEARLFKSKRGPGYFGVKRFDRTSSGLRHMHTVSGLLHVDHRIPTLDYETLMKATLWLTKDIRECEKQFRTAVFNVLTHNHDDHAKNFSFLMDEEGVWRVSPSYDLTFSSGPAGEHCTTVMGEGKKPKIHHLLKLAEVSGIKKQKAIQIINEVKDAVSKWRDFSKDANLTKKSSSMIQEVIEKIINNFCTSYIFP